DGHDVTLIDGEFGPLPLKSIVVQAVERNPQVIMLGHSGSTSGHPIVSELTRLLRAALPDVRIVYGGVFPTYPWRGVLRAEPQIDVIVRGEGEDTVCKLVWAIETGRALREVTGIAFRETGAAVATAPAPVIRDLDNYRVGWELIDHSRYSYWGG